MRARLFLIFVVFACLLFVVAIHRLGGWKSFRRTTSNGEPIFQETSTNVSKHFANEATSPRNVTLTTQKPTTSSEVSAPTSSSGSLSTARRVSSTRRVITGRPGPTNVPIVVCGDRNDLIDVEKVFGSVQLPKVELFITILTAPHQLARRMAIRNTWLSTAKNYSVAYKFFTDGKEVAPEVMKKLVDEQNEFQDLELLPTKGGYWFSHRYLHALFWASKHYSFNFYLRMDDDYFLCLNNLYNDLQYRKKEKLLYWGNMCCWPNLVAMDEGFVILGSDLLREIVRRNNSLCCHPMGGQMIAMWVNRLDHEGHEVTYFQDNDRLKHYKNQLKGVNSDLCKNIFGVHESYPNEMHTYWNVTKDSWFSIKPEDFVKVERKEYKEYCGRPKGWDWRALSAHWKHEPKPCWAPDVDWPELHSFKFHKGRE